MPKVVKMAVGKDGSLVDKWVVWTVALRVCSMADSKVVHLDGLWAVLSVDAKADN